MRKKSAFLVYAFKWVLSFFPRKLPIGRADFEKFYADIVLLSANAMPDNRSVRFAVSNMIVTASLRRSRMPVRVFVKELHKAAANQVAHTIFEEAKAEQQKEYAAQMDKANAEVTVPKTEAITQEPCATPETKP